jgi:hypothetical protein
VILASCSGADEPPATGTDAPTTAATASAVTSASASTGAPPASTASVPPTTPRTGAALGLISLGDLPGSYRTTAAQPPVLQLCPALDLALAASPTESPSVDFLGPAVTGPAVSHAVLVFADAGAATAFVDAAATADSCGAFNSTIRGTPVEGATIAVTPPPAMGEQAVRLLLKGKALQTFSLQVDVLFVRTGRLVSMLVWASVGEPLDAAAFDAAAAAAASRLEALPN